jgi:transcriptional regulator with XRE-family HTH domain
MRIVNTGNTRLGVFSERLREVRATLGYTQEQFAVLGGVKKQAQSIYESGRRAPDADYLAAIARADADVLYILTGERRSSVPLPEANQLPPRLRERLSVAISSIEAGLDAVGRTAAPKVKAELVLAAYDILSRDGEAATAQIIRLVKA